VPLDKKNLSILRERTELGGGVIKTFTGVPGGKHDQAGSDKKTISLKGQLKGQAMERVSHMGYNY